MKIYLDYNIAVPAGFPYYHFLDQHIDEIPDDVDLIGLTFFHHNTSIIGPIVDTALKKSRYVMIYFCEFNGPDVVKFEKTYHARYPNLQIFANAVPHYPSRLRHIGEWFMCLDNPYGHESWARDLLSRLSHSDHKPHKFDCLLGKPTAGRDFIERQYQLCDPKDFIFTYFRTDLQAGKWDEFKVDTTKVLTSDRVPFQGSLVSISNILPVDIYNQSHYSIISETACPDNFNFYTEKIAKPVLAQRLFVTFSGYRYLENFRKLGFQTFHGIIDESYDSIKDRHQRWQAAWDQVLFLLQQDPIAIQSQCQSIVRHNQRLMLETDWAAPIKQFIKDITGQP
jgi:hypothetical protein